jgi:hypothetical protein
MHGHLIPLNLDPLRRHHLCAVDAARCGNFFAAIVALVKSQAALSLCAIAGAPPGKPLEVRYSGERSLTLL